VRVEHTPARKSRMFAESEQNTPKHYASLRTPLTIVIN
jgi:hypothetical protein